jgi:glucose/arabinose dehydrogenase
MPRSSLIFLPALFFRFLSCCARGGEGRGAAKQLDHPWSLAFLPDNKGLLVTLKGGQLKHWQAGKGFPIRLSACRRSGQTVREDCWTWCWRRILQSRRVWLSYAEAGHDGKAGTAVGYGRLSDDFAH